MIECVLDASALLALLRNEVGAEHVAPHLAASGMAVANIGEVVGVLARVGVAEPAIRALLDPLPIVRVPIDEATAYAAGLMLPLTRSAGLSLGDRLCLALARQLGVPALTTDRAWQSIAAAVGVEVVAIR